MAIATYERAGTASPRSAIQHSALSERAQTRSSTHQCLCLAVSSASGGCGTSVFAALLALAASQSRASELHVSLADASPDRGGLDVLLGMEADEGLRWSQIHAPLGSLDPHALVEQLPQWEGISLLSADPWNNQQTHSWEVDAAYEALCQASDVVVIDCGTDRHLPRDLETRTKCRIRCFDLVPMTVQAVASERALMEQHHMRGTPIAGLLVTPPVGFCSSSRNRSYGTLSEEEICAYLNVPVMGLLKPDPSLASSLAQGLGINRIPPTSRAVLNRCLRSAFSSSFDTDTGM